ncbi:hypothetical protein NL108_016020, partial [Boleophthalmus pectinirostris]
CTGLEELSGIEPSLSEFHQTLFSDASVTLERSVQTKTVNAKLDGDIEAFLRRVSPYFLLRPAHKCLEWLIHRFHIHLYNVESLVACVLPFHDSKVFVRVIQLLQIQEPTNRWHWLHCLQKPGVPLSRLTLVTHCHKDLSFMDFICNMVSNSIQAFSSCPGGGASQLRVVFSFFASTIVSALDSAEKITDAIITKLLPHVQKGLRSSLQDFRASSLMILCQLSVKVVMEKVLVQSLFSVLCRSLKDQVLVREGLGALIVLLQNQDHAEPTHKSLSRLASVSDLVSCLESMCQTHDVSPLLRHLLPHLLNRTFSTGDSVEASSSAELLQNLLTRVPLTSDLQLSLTRYELKLTRITRETHGASVSLCLRLCVFSLLVDLYLSQSGLCADDLEDLNRRVLPVLRLLESRYNSSVDRILSSRVSDLSDDQKPLFHQLLSLSATSGKFQVVGDLDSSLLLSLNHPQASIRVMALNKLKDIITSGEASVDHSFLESSVFDRLHDDEAPVVSAALEILQLLLERLDPEDVVSSLVSLLLRAQESHSQDWSVCPVLSEAVRLLSMPAGAAAPAPGQSATHERLFYRLLPLVVPSGTRDSVSFKLSLSLSQSPVVQQHLLTAGWAADLQEALGSGPDQGPDQILVLVQTLVSTLSRNLQNMDTFSRRHTMDALCSRVELLSESGSGPDRTPLLVLLQTLVLGLKNLSDTHHLLTAQRLHNVIQRHLQDARLSQEPVSVPALGPTPLFSDWLALYLRGSDGQLEFSLVLVSVLAQFIQELKSPDQVFKEEEWWNPERLDTNTCCYLQLLAQVFSLLMGGASDGPITAQYRPLLKLLLKVHLDSPLLVFRFLSLVWSGCLHSDQVEGRGQMRLGAVLQLQALLMGAALLEKQNPKQLQEVILKTPVLASVLVVLSSPLREVRRAGLVVLRSLSRAASSPFGPITSQLLRSGEELEADPSYLSQSLGALYQDSAHKRDVSSAFRTLLQSVQSECCPSSAACSLLRALQHVHGQEVLSVLLPALDRLLAPVSPDAPSRLLDEARLLALLLGKFSPAAAPLLVTDAHCRDLFLRAIKTRPDQNQDQAPSVQVSALEQISGAFFSSLSEEVQRLVLSAMFDVLENEPTAASANAVCSVFKQLSVDSGLVASELFPPEKPSVPVSVQQTRRSKLKSKSGDVSSVGGAVSWHRVTLILELLQHKKKLSRPQALIPTLCSLLQRRLEACEEEQASVEYTKQLLLSVLLSMCRKLSPDGAPIPSDVLDPERLSVELVVQCIRSSEMSQTHHQALLLLSTLAPLYPEKVLLNIMPIFTFMGANILRLDNAYSFRVIEKTVQMVIPAIIKDSGLDSPQVRAVVTRIMQVFVHALPHVPEHRRVPVLLQLLNTVGPERYLWALLCLLCKQHSTTVASTTASTTAEEKESAQQQEWDLWVSVFCEFEVKVQIQALVQVLVFLQQLPHDKDQGQNPNVPEEHQEKMEDLIFNVEEHSAKELRHFKYLSVTFSAHLLGSARFIHKVRTRTRTHDCVLLEQILCFLHSVAQCVELNSDKPTAKFWRVLLNKTYELLDKVHALLPSDSFIAVTRGLMGNEVSNVRRKALDLLNNKLQHKTNWSPQQVSLLLSLTPDLLTCVTSGDPSVNRQAALFSLKLLCRLFGSSAPQSFVAVMRVAVGVVTATEEEDRNVTATALQCVAECVTATKALAIPHLPSLVPAVLTCLSDRSDRPSSELFLLSAVTALHRITDTLHNFTSPYLHDITAQVCRLSRLAEVSAPSPLLAVRLAALRSTIATKVPPRVLLPTVTKCYARLVQDQKEQLVALMSVLQEHIKHMDRDQLSLHQSELTTFFLTALDFRAAHCPEDLQEAQVVEGAVIECFVALVLKLSEVSFRPLFFKVLEWSRSAPCGQSDRMLTLVRLCDSVALKLRGLFVLFSGNLLPLFCDLLTPKSAEAPLFQSEEKSSLLISLVLDCLQKICLYDTNKFLSHEKAEALMGPLVDQLENTSGGQGQFRLRLSQSLVPCLGQFAVALADDSQWKNLNYQVLLKTRHPDPEVRFSALSVLLELCSKLRENYLLLLPETVPFLAELME